MLLHRTSHSLLGIARPLKPVMCSSNRSVHVFVQPHLTSRRGGDRCHIRHQDRGPEHPQKMWHGNHTVVLARPGFSSVSPFLTYHSRTSMRAVPLYTCERIGSSHHIRIAKALPPHGYLSPLQMWIAPGSWPCACVKPKYSSLRSRCARGRKTELSCVQNTTCGRQHAMPTCCRGQSWRLCLMPAEPLSAGLLLP